MTETSGNDYRRGAGMHPAHGRHAEHHLEVGASPTSGTGAALFTVAVIAVLVIAVLLGATLL